MLLDMDGVLDLLVPVDPAVGVTDGDLASVERWLTP
jgi:hypothetical protein